MKGKRSLLPLLLLCSVLLLTGCRERTTLSAPEATAGAGSAAEGAAQGDPGENTADGVPAELPGATDSEENGEPGGLTQENPDASRKEYDENVPAEILAGTDHLLQEEGEGSGSPQSDESSGEAVNRVSEQAKETALKTVPAREAEETGISEDAGEADSAMTYYTVLLRDRTESLFECQRLSLYWETAQELVTVHRTDSEHNLILNAGVYDVSARLLPENLRVDCGWVVRKNPGVIVKIVDSRILGHGIHSVAAARALRQAMMSREGWGSIDAVKSGRVLLLSGELLKAPHLQTAALLMIAKVSYPDLFADTDPERALTQLTEEAGGTLSEGIFYYSGQEEGI